MRYLTVPPEPIGEIGGNLVRAFPGELLGGLTVVCDADREHAADACRCARWFVGLSSGRVTSRAVVADINVDRDTLVTLTVDAYRLAGVDVDTHEAAAEVDRFAEVAAEAEIGAVFTVETTA